MTSNTDILMFHRFVTVMTLLAFTVMTLCDGQRAADTTALCFLFQDIVSDYSDGEPKKMMAFWGRFFIFISYGEQMAGPYPCRTLSGMTAMRFPLRCHWSPRVMVGTWHLLGERMALCSHFLMAPANDIIFQMYVCTHPDSNRTGPLLNYFISFSVFEKICSRDYG